MQVQSAVQGMSKEQSIMYNPCTTTVRGLWQLIPHKHLQKAAKFGLFHSDSSQLDWEKLLSSYSISVSHISLLLS